MKERVQKNSLEMLRINSLFQLRHIIVFEANHAPHEISRTFYFSTREINPQKLVNYTSECMRWGEPYGEKRRHHFTKWYQL